MQQAVAEGLVEQALLETVSQPPLRQPTPESVDPWKLIGALLNAYAQLDELFGSVVRHQPGGKLNDREQRSRADRRLNVVVCRMGALAPIANSGVRLPLPPDWVGRMVDQTLVLHSLTLFVRGMQNGFFVH